MNHTGHRPGIDPELHKPPPRFYWPTISRKLIRRILQAVLVLFVAGLAVAGWCIRELLLVGTAYKAKVLCSAVFVSGRDLAAAETVLQVDDLAKLHFISASADPSTRSVSA